MITVYVGGASANLRRARRFLARVRAHPDMTVSYNWIPSVEQARREGINDEDLARKDRRNVAEGCLNGIAEADAAKEAEAETARVTRAQAKAKAEEEAKAEAEAEAASEAAAESPPAPAPVTKSTSKTIPKPRTSEEAS